MATDNKNKVLNVPHLRFPEFGGEWRKYKLAEICSFFSGGTPSSSKKEYYDGNIPFIRSGELHMDKTELFITEVGLDNSAAKIVDVGDLLLALYGATSGDIAISQIKGAINQAILCIRTTQNKKFIESVWKKHVEKLLQTYLQGGQGNLSADIVKNISFYFAESNEQIKLAKFITLLDERIATQNKIIEKLQSLIKGLNNTLQYDTGGKSVCLGDILLERSERSQTNNQHEVLSSTVKGIFSQREYFSKDIASENNVGYKIIRLHDVVLSPQNLWMGNINYNDRFEIGIVSPSYKVFSIADGYDNQFVAAMLKTHRALYSYMMVSEQGASIVRRNLNMEAFSQLVFKIPSLDKQREIGYAISLLKSQLKTANKIIKAYTSQKQYLLRQMFI